MLVVWGEPKAGTWAWLEPGQIPLLVMQENLWGAECLLCVSRQIPSDTAPGCSTGKERHPLISLESLGLETAENNSVPSCSFRFWVVFLSGDGSI